MWKDRISSIFSNLSRYLRVTAFCYTYVHRWKVRAIIVLTRPRTTNLLYSVWFLFQYFSKKLNLRTLLTIFLHCRWSIPVHGVRIVKETLPVAGYLLGPRNHVFFDFASRLIDVCATELDWFALWFHFASFPLQLQRRVRWHSRMRTSVCNSFFITCLTAIPILLAYCSVRGIRSNATNRPTEIRKGILRIEEWGKKNTVNNFRAFPRIPW